MDLENHAYPSGYLYAKFPAGCGWISFSHLLAILMNEARKMWFKLFVQTVVYMPHFLNWVIVGSFVLIIFGAQQDGS